MVRTIKKIYLKVFRSKFSKNIALVAGGTALAQAIGVVFSPIITRVYPPDEYGILTAYTAVLGLLSIAASLDYQKAIPIAKDDEEAFNLLALSTLALITVVGLITILLAFLGDALLSILDSQVLNKYKYLIPIGILFAGMYDIVLQWNFRIRNYKSITITKISQSLTSNLFKAILGFLKIGPIGLVVGTIIGQSAGITTLFSPILDERHLIKKINFIEIKRVAKRYINFPLYSAPSNYVYTAGTQMPVIFLSSLFGSLTTGLFGLANSIVNIPMNLIGMSVSQVFYSEAANIGKSNPQELKRISVKLIRKLALIGIIPLITLLIFGPWLFSFVFGEKWYEAGVYARTISCMVYFHFIILPVGRILEIFERQKEGLILNVLRLLLIFIVYGTAKFMNLSPHNTIALYAISNSATYIILLIVAIYILNIEIEKSNN